MVTGLEHRMHMVRLHFLSLEREEKAKRGPNCSIPLSEKVLWREQSPTPLGGTQRKDERQWTQPTTKQSTTGIKGEKCHNGGSQTLENRFPKRLWTLCRWRFSELDRTQPWATWDNFEDNFLTGDQTRWPPDVPSHLSYFMILLLCPSL